MIAKVATTWLLALLARNQGRDGLNPSVDCPTVVVFGRPGAGKTTVANAAIAKLEEEQGVDPSGSAYMADQQNLKCLGLDLDVCVPQWMRDNFTQGIYPTLAERNEFALASCDYVEQELRDYHSRICKSTSENEVSPETSTSQLSTIISFSFVNTDLRDTFRTRFPNAAWVLVDTDDSEAMDRINQREGHFYKGKEGSSGEQENDQQKQEEENNPRKDEPSTDNSEWDFAPVTFPHVILDGKNSVESNAAKVLEVLLETSRQLDSS